MLLAEIHGDLVPEDLAERLFGKKYIATFSRMFPDLGLDKGYLGRGNRTAADERRKIARGKYLEARKMAQYLKYIPWIRFSGLTGSVAYGNPKKDDDLDMLVVVQHRRLWIARLLVQVLYRIKRVQRQYENPDVRNKICVNYYLSDRSLDVRSTAGKDLQCALELAVVKPLYKETYLSVLLAENRWISKYFPALKPRENDRNSNAANGQRIPVLSGIFDMLDLGAMFFQVVYMKLFRHHPERSHLSRDVIQFFHRDAWTYRREKVRELLQRYDLNGGAGVTRDMVNRGGR